jgi:hypothetical protein
MVAPIPFRNMRRGRCFLVSMVGGYSAAVSRVYASRDGRRDWNGRLFTISNTSAENR